MKVEIITIGDEILQGQTVDTNSAWIAQQLLPLHMPVVQITTIADRREVIWESLQEAESRADVILVTGGLGPTKDDVTKQTAADFFGTRLVRDEVVLDHVRKLFQRLNREMPVINESQADVLEGGEVFFNEYGTAPGLAFERNKKLFAFLPGVPFEMRHLVSKYIVPRFSSRATGEKIVNQYILTAGIGESHLAEQIRDIEERLPNYIRLAFLPKLGLVRLRLTGVGKDAEKLQEELTQFAQQIGKSLESYLVSYENVEFEEALLQKMKDMKLTLGTAESCTGGNIARKLTEIPGSSAVFQGSIVSYSNEVKHRVLGVSDTSLKEYGAVSEEVVTQMVQGAQRVLDVDFAVATSGIAGPSGGSIEKPVGTVWIAVASRGNVLTRKFQFHNDRLINIERSTASALLLLWNELKNH